MKHFYIYEGQNEAGPFTLEQLKARKLSRTTPLRLQDSDKWMPAETLAELKPLLVPRKIAHPKDIVPAVGEHLASLHRRKPLLLYGCLLLAGLLAGSWLFWPKPGPKKIPSVASAPASSPVTTAAQSPVVQPIAAPVQPTVEPSVPVAAEKEDAAHATRRRWQKLISATNSNYGIGLLGGIKDLSVIVTNRSDYPLDEVVAKVTYYKAGGGLWKSKLITLYAVQPQDTKEQPVPDAGRGKKVKVTLYKVVSRKMQFAYTEGSRGKDPGDPYFKQ